MKHTTRTFSLVPSARTKSDTATPMSVLPAVPVVLPTIGNLSTLGIIDTDAAICCVSEALVKPKVPDRIVEVRTVGGVSTVPMITMDLLLVGPNFRPWLHLQRVSFAVLPRSQWLSEAAGVRLGYSGCLEHFTVQFDFPKREVSISAPESLSAGYSKEDESFESSRMREARILLTIGSYDSAVVMAAAALEEFARTNLEFDPKDLRGAPFWKLRRYLPPESQQTLKYIMGLRNRAVHGVRKPAIKQTEAEQVIHESQMILRQLSKQPAKPEK